VHSLVKPGSQGETVGRLFLAVILVIALPALPFGTYLIYPFVILTTWFHEMGHGLTALLFGADFERLVIYGNGSGVAQSMIAADSSVFTQAAIAAGGPLAPSMAGALLIVASAQPRIWRPALWAVAGAILLSVALYVRSAVGVTMLPLVAALLGLVAWRASPGLVRFTLQFLGVLGAMSMLRDFDYLFTERTVIGGQAMLSDTGQIEAALGLPHWVWAGLILAVSALMIGASLKYALAEKRLRALPGRLPPGVVRFRRPPR